MKIRISLLLGVLALSLLSPAWGGEGWMTNFKSAQEKAKKEGKLLFMDFTGKGWCGWCTKLDKEILSTNAFKEYAEKNLVLLELDFQPPGKLPAELEAQNKALQEKYGVEGYPTIIVLDGEGKRVGELGYQEGGPGPFIAALEKMQKK